MSVDGNQRRESTGESAVRTHCGPDRPTSLAVVEAVERATGRSAVPDGSGDSLPPLYEAVDPDALDDLFRPDGRFDGSLSFTYCGHSVTVEHDGTITVVP